MNKISKDHIIDLKLIQSTLLESHGLEANLSECEGLWRQYSSSRCAGFLGLESVYEERAKQMDKALGVQLNG